MQGGESKISKIYAHDTNQNLDLMRLIQENKSSRKKVNSKFSMKVKNSNNHYHDHQTIEPSLSTIEDMRRPRDEATLQE